MMKTPKDRLQKALVIGANPAGIAATNKLGEMGIPVTLVDSAFDLDVKLSGDEYRFASGQGTNHALRPGLLRIFRNPRIRTILPGTLLSLRHTPQGFCAHIGTPPDYVDPELCVLCGRCVEVCPATAPDGGKPIRFSSRQALPGRPHMDKRQQPLCQAACPLGVNAQGYVALARAGKYSEALELIRRDNVLPGICGRICTHPCEISCRRKDLDEPVAIRDIKRFLADHEMKQPRETGPAPEPWRKESIAVVGSGPAGLAAAAELARQGYPVTVFEKEKELGGLLRYGLGPYRLPREILDHEIENIKRLGVEFRPSTPVDPHEGPQELKAQYKAVILAMGTWHDRKLGVPGEELASVHGCLDFLRSVYRGEVDRLPEKIAIVGDGNSAFDAARAAIRLGAKVTVFSWFPAESIPADAEEVNAALEEGVRLVTSAQVTAFLGDNGRLNRIRCAPTKPGEPDANGICWPLIDPGGKVFEEDFDRAVVAIGQTGNPHKGDADTCVLTSPGGFIEVDTECTTSLVDVFAAGDAVEGASNVVRAMASGREAARSVCRKLSGEEPQIPKTSRPEDLDFPEIPSHVPSLARVHMPEVQPSARCEGFGEVALGLEEEQVFAEASRCLNCGVCSECLECTEVCVSRNTIHHEARWTEEIEHAGVVIIADPSLAPNIRGEDVLRAYNAKSPREDVYAMMLRGFAVAAEALILLGGTAQRMRGHGLSFAASAPQLSDSVRLGVFVCRCNDSYGWPQELRETLESLGSIPYVEHVEALPSACIPEGTSSILRAIREKNLTRLVLGSCVCCPLDFICTACSDQRTRLKYSLFNGTGINRAMVETCNLRGEVLRLFKRDKALALERFKGLMERSIGRAGHLRGMPTPARPYNFTTAVIGDSQAPLESAMTLAEAGMEVFLFGPPHQALSKSLEHPNIHCFKGSKVLGLKGTVGNFQIAVEMDGSKQVIHVGAVILGEKSRRKIPYTATEQLPPHTVESSMQSRGVTGLPFFAPGATSIPGLFLANPAGIRVSERTKGKAAAILAACVMPRSPRQNKGYTVVVNQNLCRGCGRCMQVCPYQAISFKSNDIGGWYSVIDEALCKGCGNCITVCPSNAADSPYRDHGYLEQMLEEILL